MPEEGLMKWINLTAGCALLLLAAGVGAQSTGPRDLAELKSEAQRRADRNLPPVGGIKPEDMREALTNVNDLQPDTWAAAFVRIGDRYVEQAKARQSAAPKEAAESYRHAWEIYNTARWPTENSAGKKVAYAKALDAFAAYGKLIEPPIEVVRIPFEGKEIVGYLRLPGNVRPAPLTLGISGLDTRKEDVAAASDGFMRRGIAVFALDMPGTGQAPIKVDVGAERMYSKVLDWVQTRPELDAKRVVVRGQSWSGYWAAILAYTERERLRGAVVHGVGIHGYFQPEWQRTGLLTREYLFDLLPARSAIFEVNTLDAFLNYGPRMSLLTQGWLDKPSAPMLLVNGEKDTQQPIADLYLMMTHGDPKDAWVNPDGGHMGRSEKWPQRRVLDEVVMPWIERKLAAPAQK
jgi:pimeloyl-ACP methyl ester carboxylesterase